MSFDQHTAVVTGAASGIGRAVTLMLLSRGCRVVGVDNAAERLDALRREASNASFHPVVADVSDEQSVDALFDEVAAVFGRADLLHSNAGVIDGVGPLVEATADAYDRVMRVNARGAFLVLRRFARDLIADSRPGAVVHTSSISGIKGQAGFVTYSMSKQAIVGLTRSAAVELSSAHIRVNAVCPGRVDTAMVDEIAVLGPQEDVIKQRPLGRMAHPDEIAGLVVWLLGDEASFATGAIYPIDGGATAG